MTNLEKFREAYIATLIDFITKKPDEYMVRVSEVAGVVDKMIAVVMNNQLVGDSPALFATAKRLEIEPTLTAIREYLNAKPE